MLCARLDSHLALARSDSLESAVERIHTVILRLKQLLRLLWRAAWALQQHPHRRLVSIHARQVSAAQSLPRAATFTPQPTTTPSACNPPTQRSPHLHNRTQGEERSQDKPKSRRILSRELRSRTAPTDAAAPELRTCVSGTKLPFEFRVIIALAAAAMLC